VLGDYMQMKAVGTCFYGAFTGNGIPFGRPFSNHDPIFFRACPASPRPNPTPRPRPTPAPRPWWILMTGVAADPSVLWPPNHRVVNVTVSYEATSNCPLLP